MGRFITFEGGDGCGKSTQLKLTAEYLRSKGIDVLETRQPGATPLGKEIRRLLLDGEYFPVPECELFLFLADRVQHVGEVIIPALNKGQWVLCDRYSDSTLAYQLAARELSDGDALRGMLQFAEVGCVPDQTFWFNVPVSVAMNRIQQRSDKGETMTRLDKESILFHQRVHDAFQSICQGDTDRMASIDASNTIQTVQIEVQSYLSIVP